MQPIDLKGQRCVVVGGGSGIGKAVAAALVAAGAEVVISSRDRAKLEQVAQQLGPQVSVLPLDMTDPEQIASWAEAVGHLDHLVISASKGVHGAFRAVPVEDVERAFDSKFFGPFRILKALVDRIRSGGSVTLFSGVLSQRPGMNCSALGAVNGAVESLTYALALELGPELRVNCCSPGIVRSDAYRKIDPKIREQMYIDTAASLPLQKVGEVEELAHAVLFLMTNPYTTGLVLSVDGGHRIRQYAQR